MTYTRTGSPATYSTSRRSRLYWNMVNQRGELVPAHLMMVTGDATFFAYRDHTGFSPENCEGLFPINNVLSFETLGETVALDQLLESEVRYRMLIRRAGADSVIERGYLHFDVDVFCPAEGPQRRRVARAESWLALTRPFHPPAERGVRELPAIFQTLDEHPIVPGIGLPPLEDPGSYRAEPVPEGREFYGENRVYFSLDRTDMYQHINTIEYFHEAQDEVARLAAESGLPMGQMQTRYFQTYFRKPFHAGTVGLCRVWLTANATHWRAAVHFHHIADGQPSAKVSVASRLAGVLV